MTDWADCYAALGLTPAATDDEVRAAYMALARRHHPDVGGDTAEFQRIEAAYSALGNGAAVLDEVRAVLTRYVVFPSPEAADAVTLYAAATHAAASLEFATRLVLKSPVKRCGKSRLLDVLAQLVARPLITANISAAALVRSIDEYSPPTIMFDELDATFGKGSRGDEKAEALRGLLNAGFGRDRPYKRWDAASRTVEDSPTFAMAVLAGIGSFPDTIEDRAVIITMRRKSAGEKADKFRLRRDKAAVRERGERLGKWVTPRAPAIGDAYPAMPAGLNDRAEDCWESLFAVADIAGGDWPQRARAAAVGLAGEGDTAGASMAERLLADLRDVFGDADAMHGETILAALCKIDEAPWADYYGKPLSARDLARLLRPYGVAPVQVKIGTTGRKGYRRAHLADPWSRYLPPVRGVSETSETTETRQVSGMVPVSGFGSDPKPETWEPPVTSPVSDVSEVSDTPPGRAQAPACDVCGDPLRVYRDGRTRPHPGCQMEPLFTDDER